MSKKVEEAFNRYYEHFHENAPSFVLLDGSSSDREVIEMLNTCIKDNKDVYEEGYLTLDPNIKY